MYTQFLLGCGCASGERLPPYILYKGKNLYTTWTEGGAAGTLFGVSNSGWMEGANFLDWFKKLFLSAVQHLSSKPGVVLFVDGHHSHLTLELIELARERGVHLVCFPPHMTHILQPLDVSVYHPLKQAWAAVVKKYKLESMADNVTKCVFPSLISKLWERSFKSSHLLAGFRSTGLYPLDQTVVQGKLAASVPFRPPVSESSLPVSSATALSTASSGSSVPTSSVSGTLTLQGSGTLVINGGCSHCGAELTPMRPHLMLHFEKLLQKKNAVKKGTNSRKRVKPQYYGEALTSDEIFHRLEDDKAS